MFQFLRTFLLLAVLSSNAFINKSAAQQTLPADLPNDTTVSEQPQTDDDVEISLAEIYRPQMTNSAWEQLTVDPSFYHSPYQVSIFNPQNGEDGERLWSQTKAIFGMGFAVIGVIALLPEDVSNWDGDIFGKWPENVKSGPVWDRDGFGLNVIGHGYFGGVYYQVARKSGYRQWDAFMYSMLMSNFYWEYGIEAFAEVPSIQDLVLTPMLGWAYGEWAYQTEQDILEGGSTVLGSETLGSISLFALDPIDSAAVGINNLFGHEVFKAGSGYIKYDKVPVGLEGEEESLIQLGVTYQFGDGKTYQKSRSHRAASKFNDDPVNTSIMSFSYGLGQSQFDSKWGLKDSSYDEMTIGLFFSKKFSARLSYASSDVLDERTQKKVRFENYNLSGQYYFNTDGNFRPYLMAGFGEMMLEEDREQKTFQTHLGLGLHYKINANFAIQTDVRTFHSASSDTQESTIGASLIYRLADGER